MRFVSLFAALLPLLALLIPASSMTFAQSDRLTPLIGATLMVGWPGDQVSDGSSQLLCQQLSQGKVGGVLFLGHNFRSVGDVRALTQYFARCGARFQPLLALDQEGGRVDRLGSMAGEPRWPRAENIGAPDLAQRTYGQMAQRIQALGFTVNFGPVTDLNVNPRSPVIGAIGRSYSPDPGVVQRLAGAFIAAHRQQSIATTLKHYPGHGSSRTDSHKGFTDITQTWTAQELAPFTALQDQAGAIMVGHLVHRGLDPSGLPATLSAHILGDLRAAFGGVIISDDMEMRAITDLYGFDTSVELGLTAGLDLFIHANAGPYESGRVDAYHAAVRRTLSQGKLTEEALQEKQQRLARWK